MKNLQCSKVFNRVLNSDLLGFLSCFCFMDFYLLVLLLKGVGHLGISFLKWLLKEILDDQGPSRFTLGVYVVGMFWLEANSVASHWLKQLVV